MKNKLNKKFNNYRDWFQKSKFICRYHCNCLIIFKMHSSCIDTLSSELLPLVKSPLEVSFRNTVESLCRHRLNRLNRVEPISFERKQGKLRWSLSESKTFFSLWPPERQFERSSTSSRPSLNFFATRKLLCGLRHHPHKPV